MCLLWKYACDYRREQLNQKKKQIYMLLSGNESTRSNTIMKSIPFKVYAVKT